MVASAIHGPSGRPDQIGRPEYMDQDYGIPICWTSPHSNCNLTQVQGRDDFDWMAPQNVGEFKCFVLGELF